MTAVNPAILHWAREAAGLSHEDAIAVLKLKAARGVPAVERLKALEDGSVQPSRAMLGKMAAAYRRPLLTFYLREPPRIGDRGEDFRTLPEGSSPAEERLTDVLLRNVHSQQGLVRAAMIDEDEAHAVPLVGSRRRSDGAPRVAQAIQDALGFDRSEFRRQKDLDAAFHYVRRLAEDVGVFVLVVENLGNHHSTISADVFRGICLADEFAPFVVINKNDSRAAWSFTLLHELTHLALGQSGIGGAIAEQAIEKFCNDVAALLLLGDGEFDALRLPASADVEDTIVRISGFATPRKLSHSMVAYRLFRRGSIDRETWEAIRHRLRELWAESVARQKRRGRSKDGGPSYYVVRRHRLGSALIDFTARMLRTRAFSTAKAARVLGVRPNNVGRTLAITE